MKCLFRVLKGSVKQESAHSLCYSTAASEHLPLRTGPTLTLVHTMVLPIPSAHDKINLLLSTTYQNLLFYCKIFFFLQYESTPCTSEHTAVPGNATAKDLVMPQQGLQVGGT